MPPDTACYTTLITSPSPFLTHSTHTVPRCETPCSSSSRPSPSPPPPPPPPPPPGHRRRRRLCLLLLLPPIARSMFMSSPFRASHRRSRSHTSLSSPSSSPIATSDKHCTHPVRSSLLTSKQACCVDAAASDSSFSAAPAFAAQPPEKWDVEAWRRGKRARHDPETPSEDADMESCDEHLSGSPTIESQPLSNTLSMSAPSTPHSRFPATSDAFQFFPCKSSSSTAKLPSEASFFGSSSQSRHAQVCSEAFSDLHKTVSEAGEGFVRRMREFEAHRSARPSRVSTLASHSDGSGCKVPAYKRGRKRPSPLSARQFNVGMHRGKGSGSEEDDSDVEIRSSCASGSDDFRGWSPSKKRAVSLSAPGHQDTVPVPNHHSLPFPIPLRSRERSSSPSASAYSNSSDEDEEIASSSGSVADRSRQWHALRFHPKAPSSAKYSPPPLSFSFMTSNNSSMMSLGMGVPSPVSSRGVAVNFLPSSLDQTGRVESTAYGSGMATSLPTPRTSKRTEKAVAALSLALANGAGSVSDYEGMRETQGVPAMEGSEVGSLWD